MPGRIREKKKHKNRIYTFYMTVVTPENDGC